MLLCYWCMDISVSLKMLTVNKKDGWKHMFFLHFFTLKRNNLLQYLLCKKCKMSQKSDYHCPPSLAEKKARNSNNLTAISFSADYISVGVFRIWKKLSPFLSAILT